jgi:hypothetical protein
MSQPSKYNFSFTGASALITETLIIAEVYLLHHDWAVVQETIQQRNLLNKVKQETFKRQFRELKKRLSLLTKSQLERMVAGGMDDTRAIILLSLAKTYPFFRDFMLEVVRNKYLLFDTVLSEADYNRFTESKSLTHPELESLTRESAKKVKQRVFTFLEQLGVLTQVNQGIILKPMVSKEVIRAVVEDDPAWLSIFLFSNEEVKKLQTIL